MKKTLLLNIVLAGVVSAAAMAQTPIEGTPKLTKVALFKNGYGFARFSMTPDKDHKVYEITNLPVISYGTLWTETSGKSVVGMMSAQKVKKEETPSVFSLQAIAEANEGRLVNIVTSRGDTIRGRLVMPQEGKDARPLPSSVLQNSPWIYVRGDSGPLGRGLTILSADDVSNIEFCGTDDWKPPVVEKEVNVLTLTMNAVDPQDAVVITGIAQGMTWSPSYKMELGKDGKGKLSAQAVIINNMVDMAGAEVELVSGYPSIKFADTPHPLTLVQSMNELMGRLELASDEQEVFSKKSVMRNAVMSPAYEAAPPSIGNPEDVIQAEDLFFYPLKNVTCAKGETIALTIFSGDVPYEHIMTWDVPDARGEHVPSQQQASNIWHCIRITNSLATPLTSAPIEFMSDGRFVGQNAIDFTGVGQKALVRINRTMEVVGSLKENITNQKSEMRQMTETSSQEVTICTVEGKLAVDNRSADSVVIQISKTLTGTVQSCSDKGEINKVIRDNNTNPLSTIKWEITIPAKTKKEISYLYLYER